MNIELDVKSTVAVTPELVAGLFWGMHCDEQAEFFSQLAKLTKASNEKAINDRAWWIAGKYGEGQWYQLKMAIKNDIEAHKQYMALGAAAFDYVNFPEQF